MSAPWMSEVAASGSAGASSTEPFHKEEDTRDVDGFTFNPYTSDIVAALEKQRRAQRAEGLAEVSPAAAAVPMGTTESADLFQRAKWAASSSGEASGVAADLTNAALFGEDAAATARRVREHQLSTIERRREASRRRCDLVDDLFQKGMDRRLRAMQRLAVDPPADRLVGRGMAQYIPAEALPRQRTQIQALLQADSNGTSRRAPTTAATQATVTHASDGAERPPVDKNALVFLTEMDGPDERDRLGRQGSSTEPTQANPAGLQAPPSGERGHSTPVSSSTAHGPAFLLDPQDSPQHEELRAHWRELGYDVVLVSASTATADLRSSRSLQGRPRMAEGTGVRAATTLAVNADVLRASERDPRQAQGGSVLVQRRLPQEGHETTARRSGKRRDVANPWTHSRSAAPQ